VPITEWSDKKGRIKTNVVISPSELNVFTKLSIADCLQTRPIDRRFRLMKIRGEVEANFLDKIDIALRIVFDL
jgi:mRNA interferase MazF